MQTLYALATPCSMKDLVNFMKPMQNFDGLLMRQSDDGKFLEFFKPEASNEKIPLTSSSVQKLANALALEYYRGKYRDLYSDPLLLRNAAGPVADDEKRSQQWIEEQALDSCSRFWPRWSDEAISFLNQFKEAEISDSPLPELFLAGTVYCGADKEEAAGDPVKYALVIRCHSADQANAALNTGIIRCTVFGASKS